MSNESNAKEVIDNLETAKRNLDILISAIDDKNEYYNDHLNSFSIVYNALVTSSNELGEIIKDCKNKRTTLVNAPWNRN